MNSINKKPTLTEKKRACEWFFAKQQKQIRGRSKMRSLDWECLINEYNIDVWGEIQDEKNQREIRHQEITNHFKKMEDDYNALPDAVKTKMKEYRERWEALDKIRTLLVMNIPPDSLMADKFEVHMDNTMFWDGKWMTEEQKEEIEKLKNIMA